MIRFLQIGALVCAAFLLTSCGGHEKNVPIWEQVKIRDLVPLHNGKEPADQLLKTLNFRIYIFEIPAEKISALDEIWDALYTKQLRFNDTDGFGANSFSAGFGQTQTWDKIGNLLRAAGGKRKETVSLLLFDGQAEAVPVVMLQEKTVFYISNEGSMEGATVGSGRLGLRIKAEKIPGSRGVRNVDIQPAFSPLKEGPITLLASGGKTGEFLFTVAGFESKMGPGDFVLVGPKRYVSGQLTLGSLFFSIPGGKPAVRIYLIVCMRIND